MFPINSGASQAYLANLDRSQQQMQEAQSQISSGKRVQTPSDDPAAVAEILQITNQLAQNQQIQSNFSGVKTELSTADSALQTAVQAVESAISLAAQGDGTTVTADQRTALSQQASAILQTLVGISQTAVNGRYIFSGDLDNQPPYQLDPTQANGVKQLTTTSATRQIVDATGMPISVAKTAQEIFDGPNGNSVFAAVNMLLVGLQTNNQGKIDQSITMLHSADQYLNGQLAFYGAAENRVADAIDVAQKFQTQQTGNLSALRDADVPTLAIQLSQAQLQQQAALSVESNLLQAKNLFSYIG
jgi:flagellar hook-associated protein 3 FlgL